MVRRWGSALSATLASVALLGSAGISGSPAQAAGPAPLVMPALPSATEPDVEYLAARYHVSSAEAQRRAALTPLVSHFQDNLSAALGDRFAGVWVDQANGAAVHVGVAHGVTVPAALSGEYAVLGLVPTDVPLSSADFAAKAAGLTPVLAGTDVTVGWSDFATGQLHLVYPAASAVPAAVAQAVAHDPTLVLTPAGPAVAQSCVIPFCNLPLRGAVQTRYNDASGRQWECAAGVNVQSNTDAKKYVMTAGHCNGSSSVFTYPAAGTGAGPINIGSFWNSENDVNGDWAIISNLSDSTSPTIHNWTNNTDTTVTGDGGSYVGMPVCDDSWHNGRQCGTVYTTGYNGENPHYLALVDMTGSTLTDGGDSGSPWSYNGVVYGIHHGLVTLGGPESTHTYDAYTGIRSAEASMNVHLLLN